MTNDHSSTSSKASQLMRLNGWVLAIATLAAAVPSVATAQSSTMYGAAAFGDLTIRVVDLDLFDGVDASYQFLRNADGLTGYASSNFEVTGVGQYMQATPGGVTNGFLQVPASSNQAAGVTGVVTPLPGGVSVAATASVDGASFLVAAMSQTLYYEYMAHSLWMAPHTQLEISLSAATFAWVNGICTHSGSDCGYVQASTFLQGSTMTSVDLPFAALSSEANFSGPSISLNSGVMTITLSNFAATSDRAYLYANAVVQGVTPVPEPSTCALILVGLLAIGVRSKPARLGVVAG